jgi:hypothetical protein
VRSRLVIATIMFNCLTVKVYLDFEAAIPTENLEFKTVTALDVKEISLGKKGSPRRV